MGSGVGPDPERDGPPARSRRSGSSNLRASSLSSGQRDMPKPVFKDGVPLVPVCRACLDAARRLHSAAEITELIADAVQRGLCTPGPLAAELREGSQRGSATPRRVLADVADGVRSTAERDAKRLLKQERVAGAVVERRGARPTGPSTRDIRRVVRRGRSHLGDQLVRVPPVAAGLRPRGETNGGNGRGRSHGRARAADRPARRPRRLDGEPGRCVRGCGTTSTPAGTRGPGNQSSLSTAPRAKAALARLKLADAAFARLALPPPARPKLRESGVDQV